MQEYIYIYINTRIITLNKLSAGSYLVLRNSRAFQKKIKIGRLRTYFFVKPSGIFLVFIPLEIPDTLGNSILFDRLCRYLLL